MWTWISTWHQLMHSMWTGKEEIKKHARLQMDNLTFIVSSLEHHVGWPCYVPSSELLCFIHTATIPPLNITRSYAGKYDAQRANIHTPDNLIQQNWGPHKLYCDVYVLKRLLRHCFDPWLRTKWNHHWNFWKYPIWWRKRLQWGLLDFKAEDSRASHCPQNMSFTGAEGHGYYIKAGTGSIKGNISTNHIVQVD